MRYFLDFEKPIAELEGKIEELRRMSEPGGINIADEVSRLMAKMTREPALMQERASAKKLVIAPASSGIASQGTPYMLESTVSGLSMASSVTALPESV